MKRPFTFINSAVSADGKISTIERRQVRISGPHDLSRVDDLRAGCDAIMIGIGTVLADDPRLRIKSEKLRGARLDNGLPENPLKVVADSMARTPPDAKVLGDRCIIAVSTSAPADRIAWLLGKCEIVKCGDDRVDLTELMSILYEKGIRRLMVEGGATINWSLIKSGLVDELYIYTGSILIGGKDAPTLVDGAGFSANFPMLELISIEKMDDGALLRWRIVNHESHLP